MAYVAGIWALNCKKRERASWIREKKTRMEDILLPTDPRHEQVGFISVDQSAVNTDAPLAAGAAVINTENSKNENGSRRHL